MPLETLYPFLYIFGAIWLMLLAGWYVVHTITTQRRQDEQRRLGDSAEDTLFLPSRPQRRSGVPADRRAGRAALVAGLRRHAQPAGAEVAAVAGAAQHLAPAGHRGLQRLRLGGEPAPHDRRQLAAAPGPAGG